MGVIELPTLADGETYVGLIGDHEGHMHHVILLPGDRDGGTWDAQMKWAKSIGGDLPTRIEQAMLWTNHRDLFRPDWYWGNEGSKCGPVWAWCHVFRDGSQCEDRKCFKYRARAVRRVPVEVGGEA